MGRDTLAALEMEEFFAGAEQPQQRQFAEKYIIPHYSLFLKC